MRALFGDLRQGVRLLRRAPGFAAVAIAALAIGIGANTAIFSVVHTLLFEPLPYGDAERLAIVWEHNVPRDRRTNVVAPANFIHWREMNQVFDDIAAISPTANVTLTGAGTPVEIPLQLVTANFFPVVGAQPTMGRAFSADEDRPQSRVVVLSDRFWRTRLNANPQVLDSAITLRGESYTVVGVMPPDFTFLDKNVELWAPMGLPPEARTPRGRSLTTVARLRPGVSFEQAQHEMTRVAQELTRRFPDFNTGWTSRVVPLREQLTGDVRPALLLMLGAVAFVLLIACANVANLLLARATARQRELAVRAALGAGRARIVRQLLAESLVLAAAGGAAGIVLAWWGLQILRASIADRLPIQRLELVGLDGTVLAFALLASLATGVLFGIVPALTASGFTLTGALKEGGRGGTGRGARTRSAFVVAEVALALMLLVGAGLLLRSFSRLMDVDAGFDSERTIAMRVSVPPVRYPDTTRRAQFFDGLIERIEQLPGVRTGGAISFLPLAGMGAATSYTIVGEPPPAAGQAPVTDVRIIAGDYLATMGIPLLRGHGFDAVPVAERQGKVIISEAMARAHWPGQDPIGKRIKVSWDPGIDDEIIGVAGDVRLADLEAQPRAAIYYPYTRTAYGTMTLVVRTEADAGATVSAIRGTLRDMDPDIALADVRTMDDVVARSVAQREVTMTMLVTFAAAALILAAVGIYGVIAYSVTQRTQEIGIRVALGAQRTDVLRMVIGQAAALAAGGIAIGTGGAFLLSRLMTDLLFEVRPFDPLTFGAVAGLLSAVALLASYVPAYRATRVDPVIALRAE